LYYLFSTFAAIAGPNINGWVIQLSGSNYSATMLAAPFFMIIALIMMMGVKRGEALPQPEAPSEGASTQPRVAENVPPG
jgi:hypothetical protein